MNENERILLRAVVDRDQRKAQVQARIILEGITSQRDKYFKEELLRKLAANKQLIELPYNLKDLLVAEDVSAYPEEKYLLRKDEQTVISEVIATYRAAGRLQELGIPYYPAALLYGPSGTGKTELARYIAYKAGLPYIYVKFSSLVDSHLGATQSNLGRVFSYAQATPCLLCFDEIDAIGQKRGDSNDVSEMSRVTIALMQELDVLPNNVIVVGTTNRFDRLDSALARRFPIKHEVTPFSRAEVTMAAEKFFRFAGYDTEIGNIPAWCESIFGTPYFPEDGVPAATVVTKCTRYIVDQIVAEEVSASHGTTEEDVSQEGIDY